MKHIAINGEIGSGKTAVAQALSQILHLQVVRAGEMQRTMALSGGLTTLQMNKLAEKQTELDHEIDNLLAKLGGSNAGLIFDSRMAWHLVPSAFKIHLIVSPQVAAMRLLKRQPSAVENYRSIAEAASAAEERYQSERNRFAVMHGVDISRLKNYDLILDTSDASLRSVVNEIQLIIRHGAAPEQLLRVSARRVQRIDALINRIASYGACWPDMSVEADSSYPIIGYLRPGLFALRSNPALEKAFLRGDRLMPALLGIEGAEFDDWISKQTFIHKHEAGSP
jgi:cytidylate kinase